MAAVPVTFQGILFFSDVGVGGGPVVGGGGPSHPSQGPGFPTNPIAPGGSTPPWGINQPPGMWGGGNMPYPDQGLPGQPPHASQGPGFPTAPIVLPPYQPGGPPVTIWPSPGHPAHPIVIPPPPPMPDGEAVKPPPEGGGWGYSPEAGWGYFPGGGSATPKASQKAKP